MSPPSPQRSPQNGMPDNANVIALPPIIYGITLLIGLLLHFVLPLRVLPSALALGLGMLLLPISMVIVLSALRALARAKTTFDARKATTAIVTDGAFRYSRNPMSLSLTLLYFGIAVLLNSLWLLLLALPLLVVMQYGVIAREEHYLAGKFGEEYQRYQRQVRRWL